MKRDLGISPRKARIRQWADDLAPTRDQWIARNSFFYEEDFRYMRFLIPEGLRVLELGCGTGRLLAELRPGSGMGVDISPRMIDVARGRYPHFQFEVGDIEDTDFVASLPGPFDVIVLSDTVGSLDDCQTMLSNLQALCSPNTRIVIAYYSKFWEPILMVGRHVGLQMPQEEQNPLSPDDIANFLSLADFEPVKREWRQLVPRRLLGFGRLVNRYLAPIPVIRRACLRHYVVARPLPKAASPLTKAPSTTVVIPCRNERGNIEEAILRTPRFCPDMEFLFVEGHSSDGTLEECQRVKAAYPDLDIKVMVQDGKGKGDAVRKGFDHARGDVLMILDADLTMPPEALPKFYRVIASGKGEFVNGSRLIYPMEKDAMRFLNFLANHVFSWLFSWLLNQRFTDTLCGTKVLSRAHYRKIAENRKYFGDFDPFGDFDLIFGAAKLNLKVVEIPIAYSSRTYGTTQISRFKHGWLLLRMVVFAFAKLKAFLMTAEVLREHRLLWYKKPVVRAIYTDYYKRIVAQCRPGRTLEIGGGTGNLKEYLGEVISTDIVFSAWIDLAADAQALPFADATFANIVAVDVLHHIERPHLFFAEAQRVLQPGGRIILMEPAITPLSWPFYHFAHPEPVDMHAEPFIDGPKDPNRQPFDANQAIPTLLFRRRPQLMAQRFPLLKIIRTEYLSLLVYPLSGGFRPWCLVPAFLVAPLLRLEAAVAPAVGRWMGFRLFTTLEKSAA